MTLRTGKERLWKPCKDCGVMMPRYAKSQQTCKECRDKHMTEKLKGDIIRRRMRLLRI